MTQTISKTISPHSVEELKIVIPFARKVVSLYRKLGDSHIEALESLSRALNYVSPELERRWNSTEKYHLDNSYRTRALEDAYTRRIENATERANEAGEDVEKLMMPKAPTLSDVKLSLSLDDSGAYASFSIRKKHRVYTLDLRQPTKLILPYIAQEPRLWGLLGKKTVEKLLKIPFSTA